jgi:hypothetical protein
MPSTTLPASGPFVVRTPSERVRRLDQLGPAGRLASYRRGEFSRADLSVWAARYPEEVPTVNGEVAWIGLSMADLD